MKKIDLPLATDDQVREFAIALQLEGADTAERSRLEGLLSQAGYGHVMVADEPVQSSQVEPVEIVPDVAFEDIRDDGPLTMFKILPTDMPGGKDPAYPSVNGRMLVMQRNMVIKAPHAFFLALQNARTGAPYEVSGGPGKPPVVMFSDVTNYPLSEVQMPPQAEIDAWHARNGQRELGSFSVAA